MRVPRFRGLSPKVWGFLSKFVSRNTGLRKILRKRVTANIRLIVNKACVSMTFTKASAKQCPASTSVLDVSNYLETEADM